MLSKEQIEQLEKRSSILLPFDRESKCLLPCPFCGGKAQFVFSKSGFILLEHFPSLGVVCMACCSQVCDNFEIGKEWWNKRNSISLWGKILNKIYLWSNSPDPQDLQGLQDIQEK